MKNLMHPDLPSELNEILDILSDTLYQSIKKQKLNYKNNREEINSIEKTLQDLNHQLSEKLSDSPPSDVVDYLKKYVDLMLQIEDLHIKKSTSFLNSIKKWSPVLVPIFVGGLALAGVLGTNIINSASSSNTRLNEAIKFEQELITNAFLEKNSIVTRSKLKTLYDANLFQHKKEEIKTIIGNLNPSKN